MTDLSELRGLRGLLLLEVGLLVCEGDPSLCHRKRPLREDRIKRRSGVSCVTSQDLTSNLAEKLNHTRPVKLDPHSQANVTASDVSIKLDP